MISLRRLERNKELEDKLNSFEGYIRLSIILYKATEEDFKAFNKSKINALYLARYRTLD